MKEINNEDVIAWYQQRLARLTLSRPEPRRQLPPMPEDPLECRWCGARRRLIDLTEPELNYCLNGCSRNDLAPFRYGCVTCGREFDTGLYLAAWCPDCEHVVAEQAE
jgi:hypothetical protein